MPEYPAIVDGESGAYGITFPDLPGVVAMGKTVDEAMAHAREALQDYAIETEVDAQKLISPSLAEDIETPAGQTLVSIPLIRRKAKI